MKRFVSLLAALAVMSVPTLRADSESERIMAAVEQRLARMGCYAVTFEVAAEGYSAGGRYEVSGTDFYLTTDDVDVYAADGVKYEVNKRAKEINIDRTDAGGSDIISNPARGFAALLEDYDSSASRAGSAVTVTLTPKSGSAAAGGECIVLTLAEGASLPERIVYGSDAGSVAVRLYDVKPLAGDIRRFDRSAYKGFEVIDFR